MGTAGHQLCSPSCQGPCYSSGSQRPGYILLVHFGFPASLRLLCCLLPCKVLPCHLHLHQPTFHCSSMAQGPSRTRIPWSSVTKEDLNFQKSFRSHSGIPQGGSAHKQNPGLAVRSSGIQDSNMAAVVISCNLSKPRPTLTSMR